MQKTAVSKGNNWYEYYIEQDTNSPQQGHFKMKVVLSSAFSSYSLVYKAWMREYIFLLQLVTRNLYSFLLPKSTCL